MAQPKINIVGIEGFPSPSAGDAKVLLVGTKSAAGTGVSQSIVELKTIAIAGEALGIDSHLYQMYAAFQGANGFQNQVSALILDPDSSGTASTATLDFNGTATASGVITFYPFTRNIEAGIEVRYLKGDTDVIFAKKVADAFTGINNAPFVASVGSTAPADTLVTLTVASEGVFGDNYNLSYEGDIEGITITSVGYTGGAGTLSLTKDAIETTLAGERFQYWVVQEDVPATDIVQLSREYENTENDIQNFYVFLGGQDTTPTALVTTARNYNWGGSGYQGQKLVDVEGFRGGHVGSSSSIVNSYFAGVVALREKLGSNVSQYITNASVERVGSIDLAAIPFHNTPFLQYLPAQVKYSWNTSELDELNAGGVWAVVPNRARTLSVAGKVVTTRTVADNGQAADDRVNVVTLNTYVQSSLTRESLFLFMDDRLNQSSFTLGEASHAGQMDKSTMITLYLEHWGKMVNAGLYMGGLVYKKDYEDQLKQTLVLNGDTVSDSASPVMTGQIRNILKTITIRKGV